MIYQKISSNSQTSSWTGKIGFMQSKQLSIGVGRAQKHSRVSGRWGNWEWQHLRNRKHVPCFYRVIQTRVEVWENEKCCGNMSRRRVFPQLFRVLPNFQECFYNLIETRSTCFIFIFENTATRKGILFSCAIITSTAHASSVSPSSYRNTIFNQSECMFS